MMPAQRRVIQQGRRSLATEQVCAEDGSEYRWAKRRKRETPAHIVIDSEMFGQKAAPISCMLRDTSSTGAKIELSRTVAERWIGTSNGMPESFRLQIPSEFIELNCRVAWAEGNCLGVQFTGPARMLQRGPRRVKQEPKPNGKVAALVDMFSQKIKK